MLKHSSIEDGINDIFNYSGLAPDMGAIEYDLLLGDINLDEYLNIFDIVILIEIVLNGEYIYNGDMNQDEVLDVIDIVSLVNIIIS